jgi:Xaa-Pro aminopeptidase
MRDVPPLHVEGNADKVRTYLRNHHPEVDFLYISDSHDLRWMTGFSGSNGFGILEVAAAHSYLCTDSRYEEQARSEADRTGAQIDICIIENDRSEEQIRKEVISRGSLGLDDRSVTARRFRQLSEDHDVVTFDTPLNELRRVKNDSELARMQLAANIADEALRVVIAQGLVDRSEREIQAELDYQMLLLGADAPSFSTIVAAGTNAAMPHHRPTDYRVTRSDYVLVDVGAEVDGYHSDMTRTIRVDQASDEISAMLEVTQMAQNAALQEVRAGALTTDIDDAARKVFAHSNLSEFFTHGLGHGVGLAIHEEPFLSRPPGTTLVEGEVVTVEPGLYRVGVGGVRVEDLVVVTKDGYRTLTNTRKDVSCPRSAQTI